MSAPLDRIRDEVLAQIARNGVVKSTHEAKQMAQELIELRAARPAAALAFDPYAAVYGSGP